MAMAFHRSVRQLSISFLCRRVWQAKGIAWVVPAFLVGLTTAFAADSFAGKRPPGQVHAFAAALKHFDLEIPVGDDSGVIKITTLTSDPIQGFRKDPGYGNFFWGTGTNQLVFLVPPNGATTVNSTFPRTELSQKKEERWKPAAGNHTLRGTFLLASVPKVTGKGEITLAQIHDNVSDNGPLLKLMCDYNERPWKLVADYRVQPVKSSPIVRTPDRERESITLNTAMEYEVTLSAARVLTAKVRKAGQKTWNVLADSSHRGQNLDAAWDGETLYFKVGCYMFDPAPVATPAGDVRYTALSVE